MDIGYVSRLTNLLLDRAELGIHGFKVIPKVPLPVKEIFNVSQNNFSKPETRQCLTFYYGRPSPFRYVAHEWRDRAVREVEHLGDRNWRAGV